MKKYEVGKSGIEGRGYFAIVKLEAGTPVMILTNRTVPARKATITSLQLGINQFTPPTKQDYLNHSCDPNCKVVFDGKQAWLEAIKPIQPGEELLINYNATEYDLISSKCYFQCNCGSSSCTGIVWGYKYMSTKEKKAIKELVLPYLLKKR